MWLLAAALKPALGLVEGGERAKGRWPKVDGGCQDVHKRKTSDDEGQTFGRKGRKRDGRGTLRTKGKEEKKKKEGKQERRRHETDKVVFKYQILSREKRAGGSQRRGEREKCN